MRRQQQPGDLDLDPGVFVALDRGESGGLVQVGHIGIEHTFTLE